MADVPDVLRKIAPRNDSTKLSDRVVAEIERLILSGELREGEKLPTETELCRAFSVSRSVIRDAVRTLSARGLVHVQHGQGTVINPPGESTVANALILYLLRSDLTIHDVLAARAAIETGVCPVAATRASEDDIKQLAADLAALDEALHRGDWQHVQDEHLAFHLDLLRATNFPALEVMLRPLQHVVMLSSVPPYVEHPEFWEVSAHQAILDAIRAHDEDRTRQALRDHYTIMETAAYAETRATLLRNAPMVQEILHHARGGTLFNLRAETGEGGTQDRWPS
jgi:DNA-binding FadR family transcriptional regulator